MVTVDLDTDRRLDEIFRKIESGEIVRLMRGERLIAMVTPAAMVDANPWETSNWDDDAWLAAAARASAKALAQAYPDDDFSDWEPPRATG